jgi:hypothetical protein
MTFLCSPEPSEKLQIQYFKKFYKEVLTKTMQLLELIAICLVLHSRRPTEGERGETIQSLWEKTTSSPNYPTVLPFPKSLSKPQNVLSKNYILFYLKKPSEMLLSLECPLG